MLVLAKRPDNSVLVVVAEKDTTVSNQVQWLFGVSDLAHPGFSIREELETDRDRIALTSRAILESIGLDIETPPDTHLDDMLTICSMASSHRLWLSPLTRGIHCRTLILKTTLTRL